MRKGKLRGYRKEKSYNLCAYPAEKKPHVVRKPLPIPSPSKKRTEALSFRYVIEKAKFTCKLRANSAPGEGTPSWARTGAFTPSPPGERASWAGPAMALRKPFPRPYLSRAGSPPRPATLPPCHSDCVSIEASPTGGTYSIAKP